jgi:hypothetical protein
MSNERHGAKSLLRSSHSLSWAGYTIRNRDRKAVKWLTEVWTIGVRFPAEQDLPLRQVQLTQTLYQVDTGGSLPEDTAEEAGSYEQAQRWLQTDTFFERKKPNKKDLNEYREALNRRVRGVADRHGAVLM